MIKSQQIYQKQRKLYNSSLNSIKLYQRIMLTDHVSQAAVTIMTLFLTDTINAYYAFQYPLDFGADMTHDSCLTAISEALLHTLIRKCPQKGQTSRLHIRRQSFNIISKKKPYQLQKNVAKNYDRAAASRICLFRLGPTISLCIVV